MRHAHFHLTIIWIVEHVAVSSRLPNLISGDQSAHTGLHLNDQSQLTCSHLAGSYLCVIKVIVASAESFTIFAINRVLRTALVSHSFGILIIILNFEKLYSFLNVKIQREYTH